MAYGICTLSVVPARRDPAGTSEMVTQLLFGEHYTVLSSDDGWIRIKTAFEQYECWISEKQHTRISESTFKTLEKQNPVFTAELIQVVTDLSTKKRFPISIGATLPAFKGHEGGIENFKFHYEGATVSFSKKKNAAEIISTAFLFLNAPYLWGGKNPFGIDCSGFVQTVYKLNGYKLPRDAHQQVETGTPLTFVEEAQAGDLAFFDNEEGRITHVGIVMDNQQMIHASGCVRIDKYDHYGIFNIDTKKYSHSLRVIKRILDL
jgi:cell wall-associated NlpC family hydrolase